MSLAILEEIHHPEINDWKANQTFPLMFSTTKIGKTRVWAVWVTGDTVWRTDGFIDGKLKEPTSHVYKGNTVRNGVEQAPLEAEKMWLKKFDDGYKPSNDDKRGLEIYEHVKSQKSQNGGMNRGVKMFGETEITVGTTAGNKCFDTQHRPMLAKKYKDWKNDEYGLTSPGNAIKFPALVQAKVDGIRCLPHITKDRVVLESRNGNNFVHLNHIRDEVKYWLEKKGRPDVILDGELYVHSVHRDSNGNPTYNNCQAEMKGVERYQFISEACKITRSEPHEYEELVQFWIFDIWNPDATNQERQLLLEELFSDYDGMILKLVPTSTVDSHEQIEEWMREWVGENTDRQGYEFEGLMVRQLSSKYVASTTHQSCLLKYKRFEDEEWEICGAEACTGGAMDGACKWICKKVKNGKELQLTAKQMGDTVYSKGMYADYVKNPKKYNGKMINIRFNETTKDGVPRFPRATAIVSDK